MFSRRSILSAIILTFVAAAAAMNADYDAVHFQKERYLFRQDWLYVREGAAFRRTNRPARIGYYTTDRRIINRQAPNYLRLQSDPRCWIVEEYTSAASRLGRGRTLPIGGERIDRWYAVGPEYTPDDLVNIPLQYCRIRQVQLRREAAAAFIRLARASRQAGFPVYAFSGFRPFSYQKMLFLNRITIGARLKQQAVARPGHSEHQLGTTVDVVGNRTELAATTAFGGTAEARWLRQHCYDFGFVLSYGPDNRIPTGYIIETWHLRYIGQANVAAWKARHLKN